MSDEVKKLQERNAELRSEKRASDREVKNLRTEVKNLTKEVGRLNVELEKVRHPPLIVGHIVDQLSDGRLVVKSSTGPQFVVSAADFVEDVAVGSRVSLNQQSLTIVGVLPSGRDAVVRRSQIASKPDVTYEDIGGLDDVLRQVRETVEYPLTRKDLFEELGVTPPKGVLLQGPPGTGKTMIAKAVANATHATFIRLVASELVQKFPKSTTCYVKTIVSTRHKVGVQCFRRCCCRCFVDEVTIYRCIEGCCDL